MRKILDSLEMTFHEEKEKELCLPVLLKIMISVYYICNMGKQRCLKVL